MPIFVMIVGILLVGLNLASALARDILPTIYLSNQVHSKLINARKTSLLLNKNEKSPYHAVI